MNVLWPRVWPKIEAFSTRIWTNKATGWLLLGCAACAVVWAWRWPQLPGTSIALLALLAAVMTIIDFKNTQKFMGFILIAAFLFLELDSIRRDRIDQEQAHDREQAKLQESFAEILHQNQLAFEATENKFAIVLSESKEIINSVTGGNSFAYVEPLLNSVFRADVNAPLQLPLTLWNDGDYQLTGISIKIIDDNGPDSDLINSNFIVPDAPVPSLAPHSFQNLKIRLSPDLSKKAIVSYTIFISAQNGMASEYLAIRRGKPPFPFAYRYVVSKQIIIEHGVANKSKSVILKSQEWSDGAGTDDTVVTNPSETPTRSPTPQALPAK